MPKTVISFRIEQDEIAKAYEGLIENGIPLTKLATISEIIRTTFYYGIIYLCKDPKASPTKGSVQKINEIFNQNKRSKDVGIEDLMKTK